MESRERLMNFVTRRTVLKRLNAKIGKKATKNARKNEVLFGNEYNQHKYRNSYNTNKCTQTHEQTQLNSLVIMPSGIWHLVAAVFSLDIICCITRTPWPSAHRGQAAAHTQTCNFENFRKSEIEMYERRR